MDYLWGTASGEERRHQMTRFTPPRGIPRCTLGICDSLPLPGMEHRLCGRVNLDNSPKTENPLSSDHCGGLCRCTNHASPRRRSGLPRMGHPYEIRREKAGLSTCLSAGGQGRIEGSLRPAGWGTRRPRLHWEKPHLVHRLRLDFQRRSLGAGRGSVAQPRKIYVSEVPQREWNERL